jgi:hypothetical protein
MPSAYQLDAFHTTTSIPGTTRLVQRVICVGANGKGCSASRSNYILTRLANATVEDTSGPSLTVASDTSLAKAEWVAGLQPLDYDSSDNVGVRVAEALAGQTSLGKDDRGGCADGPKAQTYFRQVPCNNGSGQIMVETRALSDGSQSIDVRAHDSAGNPSVTVPVQVRIDNTPPSRVDVSVDGGEGWRNRNTFTAAWFNPLELDRAPIKSAHYTLCRTAGGDCSEADAVGDGISSLTLPAPAPGEWTLSLFRRDAAGNQNRGYASVPVTLRYDPDPPQLAFEPPASADPTRVTVRVTDPLSGPSGGSIEIAREGSGLWQTLTTDLEAGHLVTRIDDASLSAGTYLLRARATDQAGNESSTDRRVDGQQMLLTLPLRAAARIEARIALQRARRHHPVTELRPTARFRFGQRVRIAGRLTTIDGVGIGGADVQVLARSSVAAEHAVQLVHTGADGRFEYKRPADSSQTIRFLHAGTPTMLPANAEVTVAVPAATSARVRPRHLRNGHAVTFSGRLRGMPPPGGKLVELQVRFPNGWQTFKTIRTDAAGRWSARYRFTRTRGTVRYRFRARLPQEAGYPFETGLSHSVSVRVRGPR